MKNLFSPEGIIMLIFAGILDVLGLCEILFLLIGRMNILSGVTVIGEIISSVTDIIGLVVIGGWSIIRGGGNLRALRKRRTGLKLGLSFLGEAIPFVGVLPFWTIYVYSAL